MLLIMDFPKANELYDSTSFTLAYSLCRRSSSGILASAALYRIFLGSNFTPVSSIPVKGLFTLTSGMDTGRSRFEKTSVGKL